MSQWASRAEQQESYNGSRFSRDVSRFSRESLMHLVWHILRVRNQLCVKIVALQFNGKSMGPSNRRYMYALIVRSIHNKQTSNVCSDKYQALNLCRLRTRLFLTTICEGKEIVHRNSQVRIKISINYKNSYMRFNSCDHAWVKRVVDFANLALCE